MAAPLPQYQREYITQLLALGNTKPQIIEKFKKRYGRKIHPTTIIRLKKQQAVAIADAHDVIAAGSEIVGAAALKQKAYRQLDRKLTRAEEDETEIDKLRAKLRAGEIDKKQFDEECARYEALTINELVKIADITHNHARQNDEDPALTPQDQAALQLLTEGLKTGNPFQLIQVLNPQIHAAPATPTPPPPPPQPVDPVPTEESPEPRADSSPGPWPVQQVSPVIG